MKMFSCSILIILLGGCTLNGLKYRSSTYRYFSPLRQKIGRSESEAELRAGILEFIPLGTPRQIVEQRIKENFHTPVITTEPYMKAVLAKSHPGWSSLRIHLYERGVFPSGYDGAYARFLLGADSKLQDVVIEAEHSWM